MAQEKKRAEKRRRVQKQWPIAADIKVYKNAKTAYADTKQDKETGNDKPVSFYCIWEVRFLCGDFWRHCFPVR